MILEILLLFRHLNLSSLSEREKKEIVKKLRFVITEVKEIFKYGILKDRYCNKPKLHY